MNGKCSVPAVVITIKKKGSLTIALQPRNFFGSSMKLRKPIANMGEILDQMSTEKTRLINEPLDVSKYVGKTHSENPMKQVDTAKLPLPKKIATVIIGSNKSFALWLTSQPLIKKQLVGLKKAITKSVLGYSYSEEGFQKV